MQIKIMYDKVLDKVVIESDAGQVEIVMEVSNDEAYEVTFNILKEDPTGGGDQEGQE